MSDPIRYQIQNWFDFRSHQISDPKLVSRFDLDYSMRRKKKNSFIFRPERLKSKRIELSFPSLASYFIQTLFVWTVVGCLFASGARSTPRTPQTWTPSSGGERGEALIWIPRDRIRPGCWSTSDAIRGKVGGDLGGEGSRGLRVGVEEADRGGEDGPSGFELEVLGLAFGWHHAVPAA